MGRLIHSIRVALIVILAGVVAAAATARADENELPLTVGEAIERALLHDENLSIRREVVTAAEAAVNGARGAYDPFVEVLGGWRRANEVVNSTFSGAPPGALATTVEGLEASTSVRQLLKTGAEVSLTAGVLRRETDSTFALLSPSYDTTLGLGVRQPLLRGRSLDPARLELRVTAADRQRSAASLQVEIADTIALVEAGYWRLAAARQALGVRADGVGWAQEQLEETETRIEQGASPETEIAQPRAELERRRGELLEAEETVLRVANSLKLLLFGDGEDDLWAWAIVPIDELTVEPVVVDTGEALAQALASRPELTLEQATLEARMAESAFAREQVRPLLDAVASYQRFGLAGTPNPDGTAPPGLSVSTPPAFEGELGRSFGVLEDGELDDASVGLAFSIPIGNRTARAGAAIAESAERQAEASLERARKRVRVEVLNAIAVLQSAGQRVEAARAAREAAEVQLDAEHERFTAGLSTNFLVLTRQNDLEDARLDEIEARADHRIARTALERANGSLLAARGIQVAADTNETPEQGADR